MPTDYIINSDFASHLIKSLKILQKSNGLPFIRTGVTLPFLAYTYKRLNNDNTPITEDYLWSIITSLENSSDTIYTYQYCSKIEEFVIALHSDLFDNRIREEGYFTRSSKSTILYDPQLCNNAPSSQLLYTRYYKALSNNTLSRRYIEYRFDWDFISDEENTAIDITINNYKHENRI